MQDSLYFDSHAHFGDDAAAVIDRAVSAGVSGIVAVGGCPELNESAMTAASIAPGTVRLALGFDRTVSNSISPDEAVAWMGKAITRGCSSGTRVSAVGELGLDYFYDKDGSAKQIALFSAMTAFAAENDLPVIVHSRDADADTLSVLRTNGSVRRSADGTLGVLHCFTGCADFARKVIEAGMFVSFSGILTFRNADSLREVAKLIPEDRLLIETDCPFLTPVPLRGQPNEPVFIKYTAECLATIRGTTAEHIAAVTAANAERLFGPSVGRA